MANNPQVAQGVLIRVRASAQILDNPDLSVTASFLGKGGITLRFTTEASAYLGTMTGAVPSGAPYQIVDAAMHIVKSTGLSDAWKSQIELNTAIGDVSIAGDATTLSNYYLTNCSILGVADLDFAGENPEFVVNIRGTYYINAALFNNV